MKACLCLWAVLCLAVVANAQADHDVPLDNSDPMMFGARQASSMVYPAYSSYGSKPRPGQCTGVITAIWCKETEDGVLTDIAYLNTETGLQLPGCSGSDWTADYTKALWLAEGESIIKVATCKGKAPHRKFESVTFITDAGQKLVCGKNVTEQHGYDHGYGGYGGGYHPASAYSKSTTGLNPVSATISVDRGDEDDAMKANDKVYRSPSARTYVPYTRKAAKHALRDAKRQAHLDKREAHYGSNPKAKRQLLSGAEEYEEDGQASATGYRHNRVYYPQYPRDHSKRRYYGQARCSIDGPSDIPVWSSVPNWYLIAAGDQDVFGLVGRGSNAYFMDDNTHYYKDRSVYVKDLTALETNPGSLTYTPGYYYDQVDPLADFKLDCTGDNCVASVYGFCWNNHYNNSKPVGVPGIITVELGETISCPKTPTDIQLLNAQLALISQRLQQASGGVVDSVAWERYTPNQCTEDPLSNSTITLQGIFVPGPGHTQQEVRDWLAPYVGTIEGLCTVELDGVPICDDTFFYVLPFTFDSIGRRRLLGLSLMPAQDRTRPGDDITDANTDTAKLFGLM